MARTLLALDKIRAGQDKMRLECEPPKSRSHLWARLEHMHTMLEEEEFYTVSLYSFP